MRRLAALSLRVKLTLVFAAAMTIVFAAVGWFLHLRVRDDLDASIRQALRARSGTLAVSVRTHWPKRERLIEPGERFAQILDTTNSVVASRPQHDAPLLTPLETVRHLHRAGFIERPEQTRLLVVPVSVGGRQFVTVVAASLSDRESAIESLGAGLLIGGGLALLLACGLGYALAAAALRPVEHMRAKAERITSAETGARLPVPAAHDEVGRLAVTLNQMLARLASAAEQERSFAANASHELRTPLAALRTELELALRHERNAEGLRRAVAAALTDIHRLTRLAEDLLVLARADSGRLPLRPTAIQVRVLLDQTIAEVDDRGRRIRAHVPAELTVTADELRLRQAIRNLLENALHHGAGDITVAARASGRTTAISVHDEGPPLTAHVLDHAFDRFATFDPDSEHGAGLGLAIVYAIAEAHGGRARLVNDETHSGVTATLELPARDERLECPRFGGHG